MVARMYTNHLFSILCVVINIDYNVLYSRCSWNQSIKSLTSVCSEKMFLQEHAANSLHVPSVVLMEKCHTPFVLAQNILRVAAMNVKLDGMCAWTVSGNAHITLSFLHWSVTWLTVTQAYIVLPLMHHLHHYQAP